VKKKNKPTELADEAAAAGAVGGSCNKYRGSELALKVLCTVTRFQYLQRDRTKQDRTLC